MPVSWLVYVVDNRARYRFCICKIRLGSILELGSERGMGRRNLAVLRCAAARKAYGGLARSTIRHHGHHWIWRTLVYLSRGESVDGRPS